MTTAQSYSKMVNQLKSQKKYLGMTYETISERSGVSVASVKRIVSGQLSSAQFEHVLSVAETLGVHFKPEMENAEIMKREQAREKAEELVALTRGNSALEGQSISDSAFQRMIEKTVNDLLAGPHKALWS